MSRPYRGRQHYTRRTDHGQSLEKLAKIGRGIISQMAGCRRQCAACSWDVPEGVPIPDRCPKCRSCSFEEIDLFATQRKANELLGW